MYIGRVAGTVVASIHHPMFDAGKLLLVDRLDHRGRTAGPYDIALDLVQAGVGDVVLVLDEGSSSRMLTGTEPEGVIRCVIIGVIDEVDIPRWQPSTPSAAPDSAANNDSASVQQASSEGA